MKTPTLEDVIRDLAKRGEISHISLTPSQNGKLWRGSFAMCSRFGISYAEDADPVKALIIACTTAKLKPAPRMRRGDHDFIEQSTVEVDQNRTRPEGDVEDLM